MYPTRPVRIMVGATAGSSPDIVARLIGQWLSERLGQPFVIENRPGASNNVATQAVVDGAPDGYTLLLIATVNAINATLYDKLNFDFIRDIAPVAGVMRTVNVMVVNPSLPVTTVPDFIAYAKANPGKVNMASAGNGTPAHIVGEMFKMMTGIDMLHVPYRSAPPALTDLLGGRVHVMFDNLASSVEHVRTGRLKALAVTSAVRSPALPDVPTLNEYLPGFEASGWFGLGAPKSTPASVIDKLNNAVNAGLDGPRMQARLGDLGGMTLKGSPADFGHLIAEETEKWGKAVKFSGAKPD
jgi:tripartite-type tricarboxylate transporter receptor subunit TctC